MACEGPRRNASVDCARTLRKHTVSGACAAALDPPSATEEMPGHLLGRPPGPTTSSEARYRVRVAQDSGMRPAKHPPPRPTKTPPMSRTAPEQPEKRRTSAHHRRHQSADAPQQICNRLPLWVRRAWAGLCIPTPGASRRTTSRALAGRAHGVTPHVFARLWPGTGARLCFVLPVALKRPMMPARQRSYSKMPSRFARRAS